MIIDKFACHEPLYRQHVEPQGLDRHVADGKHPFPGCSRAMPSLY
jgi:hypothetical protein